MICPQCNLYINNPSAATCPRCGQSLSNRSGSAPGSEQFFNAPTFDASQPVQTDVSTPATSQWMKPTTAPAYTEPVRKRSRKRRNIVSIAVIAVIIVACVAYSYSAFFAPGHPGSSTTVPGSNVLFSDPLSSDTGGWSTDTDHCFYQGNAYHIKNSFYCLSPAGNISDANITVQAEQVAGSTLFPYGIVFRRASDGNWYEFDIDSNSKWLFFKSVNNTDTTIVDYTANAAIKGGLNTINTLRVEAKGSHFVFFVNGTQVGEADDTTFTSGQTGLSAGGTTTEVAYTDFEVDKVS